MSAPYAELEQPLDDTVLLCRACLAESGEMKDMVEWGLVVDFFNVTNIQVDLTEGLSQLICTTCEDVMVKCKEFRNQCQNSHVLLKNIAKRKAEEHRQMQEKSRQELESHQRSIQEATMSGVMFDRQLIIMITAPDPDAKIYLSCPYNECRHKFVKRRDLLNHLATIHSIDSKQFTIDLQFYCTYPNCPYHVNSTANKWFPGRKNLNQHYNKVHKMKIFNCESCRLKFSTTAALNHHRKTCNTIFPCTVCNINYNTNEKLLVHLMRRHPDLHKQYKEERKVSKKIVKMESDSKRPKIEDYICDSPKRSSATQTRPEENIKNDVALLPWTKADYKTDEISTQTVFEDLLSLKSQNSEDESIFFSETVSLSDIQTQTFPVEFGLSRSNKQTITSETQSPDISIKETQTCFCLYDSPKVSYKLFDSVSSSPSSINLTSTQTQTSELKSTVKSDVWLSVNTTETQTCFEDDI